MTTDELRELIAFGREQSGVEFKGPGSRQDRAFQAKVVRAILGMTNRRDGGYVILGVEDAGGLLTPRGLDAQHLATWRFDHLADALAEYADPSVEFAVSTPDLDAMAFVVIRVEEFSEVPVICKKDYHRDGVVILRAGACYVRSRRKPESVEVSTYADMRDLIDLASDKGVRRFVQRAHGAGLGTTTFDTPESQAELFAAERGDFQ